MDTPKFSNHADHPAAFSAPLTGRLFLTIFSDARFFTELKRDSKIPKLMCPAARAQITALSATASTRLFQVQYYKDFDNMGGHLWKPSHILNYDYDCIWYSALYLEAIY